MTITSSALKLHEGTVAAELSWISQDNFSIIPSQQRWSSTSQWRLRPRIQLVKLFLPNMFNMKLYRDAYPMIWPSSMWKNVRQTKTVSPWIIQFREQKKEASLFIWRNPTSQPCLLSKIVYRASFLTSELKNHLKQASDNYCFPSLHLPSFPTSEGPIALALVCLTKHYRKERNVGRRVIWWTGPSEASSQRWKEWY